MVVADVREGHLRNQEYIIMKRNTKNPIEAGLGRCKSALGALALLVPFMTFGLISCETEVEEEEEEVEIIEDDELEETE